MIHQHRDRAKTFFSLPDRAMHLIGNGDICRQETGAPAGSVDLRSHFFALAGGKVQDRYLRAFFGKQ
ncbi:hypothetical protein D9M71_791620 [compost metagenome]